MSAPWGYSHRDDRGPRGWVARWNFRRRVARVEAARLQRVAEAEARRVSEPKHRVRDDARKT